MNMSPKKKILYEYIDPLSLDGSFEKKPFYQSIVNRLKGESITKVFVITPRVGDPYAYLRFVHSLEQKGFSVRSVYLNALSFDVFHYAEKIAKEVKTELSQSGCMVLSYGSPYTAALIGVLFITMGRDADTAIARVEASKTFGDVNSEVRRFLYDFERYYGFSKETKESETFREHGYHSAADSSMAASPSRPRPDIKKDNVLSGHEVAIPLQFPEKGALPQKQIAQQTPPHQGTTPAFMPSKRPFYTSLRFKLISVISTVIVLSLSGMIFLATYYFKGDNRIRVQQSNLDIAKIMALKVRSDFLSIIDISKAITNEMLARQTNASDSFSSSEKTFLFNGIAVNGPGPEKISLIKTSFNKDLLEELQIDKNAIQSLNDVHAKNFMRAFGGDIVVENASAPLRFPVMVLAYPIRIKGRATIDSIAINYIRLDKVLLAFKGEDRIGYVFMVNERGDVIAHQEGEEVLAGRNYIALPIVKEMLKSPQTNGQIRYKDESGKFFLGSFWKIGVGGCGIISTVEEDVALRQVYDMQRRNLYLMVIVLTLVIMIVFFFGTRITEPIIRLVEATKRIKEGQYRVDVSVAGKDEIAELTQSFVEMGIGLEEREKMKDAFGKFVNKEVAEKVLKGELRLGGERKNAAVFFSDIRSFTAISEKLAPEEVVEFLNEYMTRMVNCVNNTNGVVDKFIGDAIMAIWGAPVSHGNDTENAVNAALMMRNELMIFNKGRGSEKKPIIKIGCGINYGPVLAGQIGSEDRMEYTVIGDTVNLASRIEALNKPFGTDILISEDAYQQVRDIYHVEPMQKIKVKGKSAPQQIYAVLGRKSDLTSPKSLEELRELLGIEMKGKPAAAVEEEVKYEILEQ